MHISPDIASGSIAATQPASEFSKRLPKEAYEAVLSLSKTFPDTHLPPTLRIRVNFKAVQSATRITVPVRRRTLRGLAVKDGYTRHPLDLEFGVRTSGLIPGRHLKSGQKVDRHNTAYFGVAPSIFHEMIVRWRRTKPIAAIDEFAFIDLGAGMGRAVLLATEFPFRAVIGVELNPILAQIARRNMVKWRAAGRALAPVRLLCRDAGEFELPSGPCVVFLFNPFGAPVLKRLVRQWSHSFRNRQRELDIIYVNTEQERVIRVQPGFVRLFSGEVRRSQADAIADHRILANQPSGEYAVANFEDCSIFRWVGKSREQNRNQRDE